MTRVVTFVQSVRVRIFRRLSVIQCHDRQARLPCPAQQLIVMASRVHGHKPTTRNIKHNLIVARELLHIAVKVQPGLDRLFVVADPWPLDPDLPRLILAHLRPHDRIDPGDVRRARLVPAVSQVIQCQRAPDIADHLIRLLSTDKVVDAEDQTTDVTQPFRLDAHGSPEASIQRRSHPCRPEIASLVQIRERFRRFQSDDPSEVARDVQRHTEDYERADQRPEECYSENLKEDHISGDRRSNGHNDPGGEMRSCTGRGTKAMRGPLYRLAGQVRRSAGLTEMEEDGSERSRSSIVLRFGFLLLLLKATMQRIWKLVADECEHNGRKSALTYSN
nr:hypothetical protein CFP56_00182 [Quercus suber]